MLSIIGKLCQILCRHRIEFEIRYQPRLTNSLLRSKGELCKKSGPTPIFFWSTAGLSCQKILAPPLGRSNN